MLKPLPLTEDQLDLLHHIHNNSNESQRKIAKEIGLSIGKVNYCLRKLLIIGLIKVSNFKNSKNKFNYAYILTPKGIYEKSVVANKFIVKKQQEYDKLMSYIDK
jgi:EPS-associated MarR family transcriptional regulator